MCDHRLYLILYFWHWAGLAGAVMWYSTKIIGFQISPKIFKNSSFLLVNETSGIYGSLLYNILWSGQPQITEIFKRVWIFICSFQRESLTKKQFWVHCFWPKTMEYEQVFPKPPFKLFILLFSQCETSFWLTDFFLVLDVSLVSGTECLCTWNLVKSSSDVTAARTLVIFARFYHTDKAEATYTVQ